ncbi:glycosyltransferase [bacterium]|nr:glycosyltransferase [bacterium]
MEEKPWLPVTASLGLPLAGNLSVLKAVDGNLWQRARQRIGQNTVFARCADDGEWDAIVKRNDRVMYQASAFKTNKSAFDRQIENLSFDEKQTLLYLLGLDAGYSVKTLFPKIENRTHKGIVIVEPDMDLFLLALSICDLREELASYQVFWVVGGPIPDQLSHLYWKNHLYFFTKVAPVYSLVPPSPERNAVWSQIPAFHAQLANQLKTKLDQELQQVQTYYARKPLGEIQHILASGGGAGKAVPYIQKRFLLECERLGIAVTTYPKKLIQWVELLRQIILHKPDILFFVNYVPKIQILDQLRIPRAIWCIDDPNSFFSDSTRFCPHDFLLTWDRSYRDDLLKRNAAAVDYFPYVADLDLAQPNTKKVFQSPVSYIGQVLSLQTAGLQFNEQTLALVNRVAREKAEQPRVSYQSLLMEYQKEHGLEIIQAEQDCIPQALRYGIYIVANALYRTRVLKAVRPFGLKFYGNREWEKVLQGDSLLECYQGEADPLTDVPDIFVSSHINLNIHSLQAQNSLNQRDFNCPVLGGFLLSDWVEGADEFFQPGEELIFYHGIDDLVEKVEYYLNHREEREQIIQKGKQRVQAEHTYAARVPHLLERLQQQMRERYGRYTKLIPGFNLPYFNVK